MSRIRLPKNRDGGTVPENGASGNSKPESGGNPSTGTALSVPGGEALVAKKVRIAVFVSGGGTNLEALLKASEKGEIPHGEFALVLSSREDAYALTRAKNHGVPCFAVPRKGRSQAAFEAELTHRLSVAQIDVIVLAGFLTILSEDFVRRWPCRILNVHPSLIPSFCGEGFYGLKVHQAALDRGVKLTGATVHFVNEIPDGGPILLQKAVKVLPGDTAEKLQKRVMKQAEWVLLPQATELVCQGIAEGLPLFRR